MSFDFNLLLALYLLLVAMTVVLYTTWHYNRDIDGLSDWLLGYVAALANLTQFLWSPLQSELALVLSNQVTMMATGVFALRGCCRHMNLRFRFDLAALALMLIVLALASYYTVVVDSLQIRFVLSSVASGLFFATGGAILLRDDFAASPLRHLFGLTLLAHGLFIALRGAFFVKAVVAFLQRIPLSPTNLILYEQIIMASLLALGVVLVTNEVISAKLRAYAEHDALTSLYNRRMFLELLEKSRSLAARTGTTLSLLVLDIDHFKSINDNFGHLAGDQVLSGFAARMQGSLRKEDVMGRLGGEEFAIFLPDTPIDVAVALAERLRAIVELTPVPTDKGAVPITMSVGVATVEHHEAIVQAIELADEALYEAKRGGRNRIVCSRSDLHHDIAL